MRLMELGQSGPVGLVAQKTAEITETEPAIIQHHYLEDNLVVMTLRRKILQNYAMEILAAQVQGVQINAHLYIFNYN